ncbi:Phosphatidylinositol N-acetylglucosaminyltransferase subunit P [Toxocara canis]|uniref:Phosphatidylinositol N-acetylglucosaminyltransferase subunit P n=1 Tax=Toxocara canis TaxID=6265 RepID=A0A0B2VBD4_TOXCA|nr:Phosphatidylinositol N-acetylglucosaminyltransferase subunit P [Toxocara canis]
MDVSDDTTIDEVLPPYATPNPYPARGIYGFALFLISSILFALYLIWALVPTPWLNTIQFTYVPAKYWAVAIPLLFPLTVVVYVTAVFAINLINFHGVFDDIEVIENDFGDLAAVDSVLLKKFPKTTDTEKSL